MKYIVFSIVFTIFVGVTQAMTSDFVSEIFPWMYSNGLTNISESSEFRNNDFITRGEASKFIAEFGKLKKLPEKEGSCNFSDISGYDSTLIPSIHQACKFGLLKGSDGKFMPNDLLTEAQAIAIVIRSVDGLLDESESPWYTNYYAKAVSNLYMISTETLESINTTFITREKLATWFYLTDAPLNSFLDDMNNQSFYELFLFTGENSTLYVGLNTDTDIKIKSVDGFDEYGAFNSSDNSYYTSVAIRGKNKTQSDVYNYMQKEKRIESYCVLHEDGYIVPNTQYQQTIDEYWKRHTEAQEKGISFSDDGSVNPFGCGMVTIFCNVKGCGYVFNGKTGGGGHGFNVRGSSLVAN